MLKNNIKKILERENISINKLSNEIDIAYANTHNLVNLNSLDKATLKSIVKVANFLEVDIEELYIEVTYIANIAIYDKNGDMVQLFDTLVSKADTLEEVKKDIEDNFSNLTIKDNFGKVEYLIESYEKDQEEDPDAYEQVDYITYYVNDEKLRLVSLLFDEIGVYPDDIKEFVKDTNGRELTENVLKFNGEEHDVYWYLDEEGGKEGFIDIDTEEIYTPDTNRIDYLEGVIDSSGMLEDIIEDYEMTHEEIEEIEKRRA